mmetsp:Transcript_36172/g.78936  ORF Transcript_36172/g.78936 Transcript_36172/m.78936 type:complete len:291 (+) Transcript_36172:661-1533(+)
MLISRQNLFSSRMACAPLVSSLANSGFMPVAKLMVSRSCRRSFMDSRNSSAIASLRELMRGAPWNLLWRHSWALARLLGCHSRSTCSSACLPRSFRSSPSGSMLYPRLHVANERAWLRKRMVVLFPTFFENLSVLRLLNRTTRSWLSTKDPYLNCNICPALPTIAQDRTLDIPSQVIGFILMSFLTPGSSRAYFAADSPHLLKSRIHASRSALVPTPFCFALSLISRQGNVAPPQVVVSVSWSPVAACAALSSEAAPLLFPVNASSAHRTAEASSRSATTLRLASSTAKG